MDGYGYIAIDGRSLYGNFSIHLYPNYVIICVCNKDVSCVLGTMNARGGDRSMMPDSVFRLIWCVWW